MHEIIAYFPVMQSVPAFDADAVENRQQVFDAGLGFFFAFFIEYNFSLVHHNQAAAVAGSVAQVMCNHNCRNAFAVNYFVG